MKKTATKILGLLIAIILISQHLQVFAVTAEQKQLEQEKSENEDMIKEKQEKAEQLENEKSETMKAVEELIPKISESESTVEELQNKVNDLQSQITTKEENIQTKEEEYTKEQELLDARLIAIYESGETSYLDVLLTASSMTDFLAKYNAASELIEYDKELIQSLKDQKEQIEKEKNELEESKKELDTSLAQQKEETVKLQSLKNEKQSYANKLSSEEKELEKEIEELENANKKIQNEIKQAEIRYQKQLEELKKQQENNSNTSSGSGSNGSSSTGSGYFMRPVSSGSITAKAYYSSGKFHGGVDFGVSVGTTVMAAADGVVMSTANLSGSYGTYVVIRHANGMQTYYAHGTPGSICVKPGQTVKRGEKIMLSGNSGNSSGPHLHFEVRVSPYSYSYSATAYGQDSRVNPLNYM